jgi:hypothetical protein
MDKWSMQRNTVLKNNVTSEEGLTALSLGEQKNLIMRKVHFDHKKKVASTIPPETISEGPSRMNTMENLL